MEAGLSHAKRRDMGVRGYEMALSNAAFQDGNISKRPEKGRTRSPVINCDTGGGLLDHIRVTFKIATANQLIDPIEQQLEQLCEVLQLFQAEARQDTIHIGAPGFLD